MNCNPLAYINKRMCILSWLQIFIYINYFSITYTTAIHLNSFLSDKTKEWAFLWKFFIKLLNQGYSGITIFRRGPPSCKYATKPSELWPLQKWKAIYLASWCWCLTPVFSLFSLNGEQELLAKHMPLFCSTRPSQPTTNSRLPSNSFVTKWILLWWLKH